MQAPPLEVEDPSAGLHALMGSTYEVLLAHPELVPLYVARQGARGPNAVRLGEVMLELLARSGASAAGALAARRVLIVYTIGFAAFATSPIFDDQGDPRLSADEIHESLRTGLGWLLAAIKE